MFRTVKRLMALSLGTARAQLLQRTKATEPRPCLERPLFLLFFVMMGGGERKMSLSFLWPAPARLPHPPSRPREQAQREEREHAHTCPFWMLRISRALEKRPQPRVAQSASPTGVWCAAEELSNGRGEGANSLLPSTHYILTMAPKIDPTEIKIIYLRAVGGEVGASSALAPKIGPLGLVRTTNPNGATDHGDEFRR